jgi:hypothetical protein
MPPDYIIIGTQRGGSTSLYNYIRQHPQANNLWKPRREIHFFDYPHNWAKGVKWYRQLFRGQKGLTGEKSPTYLDHPLVPARIARICPDAKLIAILRNPVDRAHSDYWKIRAINLEPLKTFKEAIEAEPERLASEDLPGLWDKDYFKSHHCSRGYLRRGEYATHLARWFEHFPREQLLIIKSEELFLWSMRIMRAAYNFLNLPPFRAKKYKKYQKLRYPAMNEKTRQYLRKHFRPYNMKLAEMLGDVKWMW